MLQVSVFNGRAMGASFAISDNGYHQQHFQVEDLVFVTSVYHGWLDHDSPYLQFFIMAKVANNMFKLTIVGLCVERLYHSIHLYDF